MNIEEIAQKLVEFCKVGDYQGAHDALYSPDCISIESGAGMPRSEVTGLDAIAAKGKEWAEGIEEVHSLVISDALVASTSFAVTMEMDVTSKAQGRNSFKELCVYTVLGGKIVKEEFIY